MLVLTYNLYYLGALNTSFPAVVNMSAETLTYSREQLVQFQNTEQRGNIYDWSHIYSIVKPREHPASVSPTLKPQATYYKTHQQRIMLSHHHPVHSPGISAVTIRYTVRST